MDFTEEELIELVEQISRRERSKLFWRGMAEVFLTAAITVIAYKGMQKIAESSKD